MTRKPIIIPAAGWSDPAQHRVMKTLETELNAASAAIAGLTDATGALQLVAVEQAHSEPFLIEFADNKSYTFVSWGYPWTIDSVVTKCTAGTCTVTVSIDGVSLGGTANAASTAEQTQVHTTANTVATGQDIAITVSANAAAEGVSVTLIGRRTFVLQ